MLSLQNILFFLCVLLSGLIAGLLYSYACSINPGLSNLNDSEYLRAMQSINKEILNTVFFISFAGTLIILPVATWYSKSHAATLSFYLLLAASIVYLAGVFGVTAVGNIPLNNALAKFNISSASASDILNQRKNFEASWNRFHLIRTVFSILANALTIAAVIANNVSATTQNN